ncbi:HlyD family type I secretion periplasmic adaptor subunit [Mesorhizobium sp. CGMCC 1.15528]|uniref:Membrane fusion protein (MFP) family protein n=1 Tax=Mesorhizobium zhangyense TaxID=1776730 RepID=A0A7C9R7C6_9HYPH|nr:HlyD family type I secretion periplasmic adaptor subunit [Mesorhizobium zhangyense]NGN41922.1 HlyD family type I secretion periplasmic adaptor subunit [Mesorhizobium zhangyense]
MTDVAAHNSPEWYADVPRSIRKQTLAGLALLALCFGGFGTWATTAPLAAAVITQGSFVATGQNKIVQHLEGGIIKELLVSEGDVVKVNQPLLRLDETAARVNERQFFLRRLRLEGIVARLSAEAAGMTKVSFPKIMQENRAEEDVAAIMASQELNFQASRGKLDSEIGLLDQNIKALEFRATGYQQQWDSMERQLSLLNEEYTGKKILSDQGLLRKTELKAVQRAMADAEGQMGRLAAEVSETNAQITKHHQQVVQTIAAYKQAALDELQSVEAERDSVRQQSHEAENVLDRATIHAPVAGTVVRMLYHTSGGVIESGKSILEILPADVPLVIETQVPRTEIDTVRVGQKATIQLIALNRRTTPVLNGEVYYVSADSLPDTSGDQNREVYLARVKLAVSELSRVPGFSPTPGMPVEIMIQTAERTFFSYLAKPVTDSMSRAFMEQ